MNGNTFIYLTEEFLNFLYKGDRTYTLECDPICLIDKWLGNYVGKRTDDNYFGGRNTNTYGLDRTGILQGILKQKNLYPIPKYDDNYSKSFKQICEETAKDILNEGKTIDIFWSGGVDSTLIVTTFLNICKDLKQINIIYDKGGIDEYPLFHKEYVKQITPEPINDWIYDNAHLNLKDNIIVTGHLGGILGQYLGQTARFSGELDAERIGCNPKDFKYIPWQDVFLYDVPALGNQLYDECFLECVTPQVKNAPIEIKSIADLRWWLNFSMKWQPETMTPIRFIKKINHDLMKNCKIFFNNDDFQKWALWNYDKNLRGVLPPYRKPLKDIIYEFTRDEEYYKNKGKQSSGPRFQHLHNQSVRQIRAIDDQYNVYFQDNKL